MLLPSVIEPAAAPPLPFVPSLPEPAAPPPSERIAVLQAGRALAACLVVLVHNTNSIFIRPKYFPHNPVGQSFDFGARGVEFFFVLSGFIIMAVHWRDVGQPRRAGRFLFKRFWRIYPFYWLILTVLVAIFFAVPSFGDGFETQPSVLISSYLLIGGWRFSPSMQPLTILSAAWTLYFEVLFYAAFLVLVLNRRIGTAVLAGWFALCLANYLAGPFGGPLAFIAAPRNLLFPMGMAACAILRRGPIRLPWLWAVPGTVLFFASAAFFDRHDLLADTNQTVLCGLGAAAAVIGLVELERRGSLRVPPLLLLLGDASYAIYLVHLSVLVLLAKLFQHLPGHARLPLWLDYAAFFAIAVVAGTLAHLFIERRFLRLRPRRPAPA